MATFSKNQKEEEKKCWYCPETGIYSSKHPPRNLPTDPFLDVVSFIFSHEHNNEIALVDASSGFSISYPQLQNLVKSMAFGLTQMGVSHGDVVLILLQNCVYFPIVLLGILHLGAVATTMNPLSSLSEIKKQTVGTNVTLAFTSPDRVDELSSTLGIPSIAVPINMSNSCEFDFSTFFKLISNRQEVEKSSLPSRKTHIRQQDTAAILYSSGTMGANKGVVLTHANFIAAVELFVRFEASQYYSSTSDDHYNNKNSNNNDDVYLAVIPMFHIYGLSLFTMGLLSLGTKIVVMTNKFDADEMVRAIDKYGVTHFPAVPPLLTALINKAKTSASTDSLKSLKQVSNGAAPLSTSCIEEFIQALPHVDFIQGYGLSESTAVGTRGFNTKDLHNYSSVGLLGPNTEAKVVDWITGLSLPPGKTGELWLRGPGVMKEYLNNVEATKLAIDKEGWLRTGDIVYFDQQGYLYIVDRLKEIIKYKGFQIAPADLEDILLSHPAILDAAVTGEMDEDAGEVPVAFVVKKPRSGVTTDDIIDYVAKQVSPYKKVRKVIFVKSIPRSASGKILRRELKKKLCSRL